MPVFLDPLAQAKGYIFNQAKYMLDIYNATAFWWGAKYGYEPTYTFANAWRFREVDLIRIYFRQKRYID